MRSSLFPGLDSLVGLARHGVDVKPTLLRVLTDLYVQKPSHTAEEERQFVELTLRLVDAVDAPTREAVARKLADYAGAPPEVVERLAGGTEERATISASGSTAREPPDVGLNTGGVEPAWTGRRFFAAEPPERTAILAALDALGPLGGAAWVAPAEDAIRRLEATALAGRPGDFIRELERALGVARAFAESIVNDRSGEPLVVVAKALAMPVSVLQRILLFVNPSIGHSVRRVYALTALFDQISPAAALRLVASWRAAEPTAPRRPTRPPPGPGQMRGRAFIPARRAEAAQRGRPEDASSADDAIEKTAS